MAFIVALVVLILVLSPFSSTDATRTLITASRHTAWTGTAIISGQITIVVRPGALPTVVTLSGPTNFSTLADLHASWDGFAYEVRFVNGVEYFASPRYAFPGGGEWMPYTPLQPPAGIPPTDRPTRLDGISNNGVQLLAGVNSAHSVGPSVVDGVPATQYSFTTSLAKAVQAGPERLHLGLVQLLTSESSQIDTAHMPGKAWLDSQGRVRRLTLSASGHGFSLSMDDTFSQFGVPVHVTAPAATLFAPSYDQLPPQFFPPVLP